ncbi:hypothetical protein [Natrinema caseinilyticum]|uniref:hypothetical protein n=1 Tax=Natrinema caseinilyticum TaxID=2961570 RepID=UPI0020C3F2A9|nr:hypothetical protein [Natrinema caseinilyticum]
MKNTTRRKAITGIGGVTMAALAGCTSSISGAIGGPRFEKGDERDVMFEASWFGDGWEESEAEGSEGGVGNSSNESEDDEDEWDLGFDTNEVPYNPKTFEKEDDDGFYFVMAAVGILEDGNAAESAVEDFGRREMVDPGDPDVGDTSVRGEVDKVGVLYFSLDNAVVLAGAATLVGFDLNPDHGRALEAGEELESRLKEL